MLDNSKAYRTGEESTTKVVILHSGKRVRKNHLEIIRIFNRRRRPTSGKSLFTRKWRGREET